MAREESYVLGHEAASDVMAQRDAARFASFFTRHLSSGMRLLDCGCGPGTITIGLAESVAPGEVVGIDFAEEEVIRARTLARQRRVDNVRFEVGDATKLEFAESSFDAVFFHGLLCHLNQPITALREARRVAKPGAVIGAREPDARGNLIHPDTSPLARVLELYEAVRRRSGQDPWIGSKLRSLFDASGLSSVDVEASFECYADRASIESHFGPVLNAGVSPGFIALLEAEGLCTRDEFMELTEGTRLWARADGSFFARAWCEAVGGVAA